MTLLDMSLEQMRTRHTTFADGSLLQFSSPDKLVLGGTSANDQSIVILPGTVGLHGQGGDDILWGGSAAESLSGGPGHDTLSGGGGDDHLDGDEGIDVITTGAGADTISYVHGAWESNAAAPDRITDFDLAQGDRLAMYDHPGPFAIPGSTPWVWRGEAAAGFTATPGQDVRLAGARVSIQHSIEAWTAFDPLKNVTILYVDTDMDQVVDAGEFAVSFDGRVVLGPQAMPGVVTAGAGTAGDDLVRAHDAGMAFAAAYGFFGNDTLLGGDGNDMLRGHEGNDRLLGGHGANHLQGGGGSDTIEAGDGDDTLWAAASAWWEGPADSADTRNVLRSGGGDDSVFGSGGRDVAEGGDGDDALDGGDGDDTLKGGRGNDTLDGGHGSDVVDGGGGNDVLLAEWWESAFDTLIGGSGDDVLYAGSSFHDASATTFSGGPGADRFAFTSARTDDGFDGSSNIFQAWGLSDVLTPDRITDFNEAEGDRLRSGIVEGRLWHPSRAILIWRGEIDEGFVATGGDPGFRAELGQAVGGRDFGPEGFQVWFLRDAEAGQTILYLDRNQNFVVDEIDLKLLFDGLIVLSPASFTPGTFTDFTWSGTGGADVLVGSDASDLLHGGAGADDMRGGGGADTLGGGLDGDSIDGGQGNDLLTGGDGDDAMAGDVGDDVLEGGSGEDTLAGGDGNDRLRGDFGRATLDGGAGDDTLEAGESDSLLDGGAGADQLQGLGGGDLLLGGDGVDSLMGGGGNDTIEGGSGADRLDGYTGDDRIVYDPADPHVEGGFGLDLLVLTDPVELALGNFGDQVVGGGIAVGFEGADGTRLGAAVALAGSHSLDWFVGSAYADTLAGAGGNDILDGGPGADSLSGGAGDDTYVADVQDILVEMPDEGVDTVIVAADYRLLPDFESLRLAGAATRGIGNETANSLAVDATASQPTWGRRLDGLGGNDTVMGGAGADTLDGGSGDDWLVGGQGGDRLLGRDGADRFEGGPGDDTGAGGGGNDVFFAREGSDFLQGDGGNDVFTVVGGPHTLEGGAGHDVFDVLAREGVLRGGRGDDTYWLWNVSHAGIEVAEQAEGGFDTLLVVGDAILPAHVEAMQLLTSSLGVGNSLANHMRAIAGSELQGLAGNDTLQGSGGDDSLSGGIGDDTLNGGAGNDWLSGDEGRDHLVGGSGADIHAFVAFSSQDTVVGFSAAEGDRIVVAAGVNGSGIASAQDLLGRLSASGTDAVLDLGGGHTVTLLGVAPASLGAELFVVE